MKFGHKTVIILGLLTLSILLITQPFISSIRKEVKSTTTLMAKLISGLVISSLYEENVAGVVSDVIKDVSFPIIITDQYGIPRAWEGIGVSPRLFTQEELNRPDLLRNNPAFNRIMLQLEKLRYINKPIQIKVNSRVTGYLYYGYPPIISYLRIFPFLLLIVGVLAFIGFFLAARSIHAYEIETVWLNFAKGLAHQMGTPVSALLGWYELLKTEPVDSQILMSIKEDISRLSSILKRFSRVGGQPVLSQSDVKTIANNVLKNAEQRFLKNVRAELDGERCMVNCDEELIGWSIENLLKNAYEARGENPEIKIHTGSVENYCIIRVSDNGKGISKELRRKMFRESFTTKKKGWGVGLLLTRRIVEEIHGGKVSLVVSQPDVKTVFEIKLPAAQS